jgi:hypothetical protein
MPDAPEPERVELIQSIAGFLKPLLLELSTAPPRTGPGWPWVLPAIALWAGGFVGVARGFSSQLEIWRLLTAGGLWDLPHYAVTDDAVYKRLKDASRDTIQTLFAQVTTA